MKWTILALLLFSSAGWANFMVYPMTTTLDMDDGQGSTDKFIKVYSKVKDVLYIRTYVRKIVHPGEKDEKEINVDNWKQPELVVSPEKIIVSPGGYKTVRLTQIIPPKKEELYRVYFESASAGSDAPKKYVSDEKTKKRRFPLILYSGHL